MADIGLSLQGRGRSANSGGIVFVAKMRQLLNITSCDIQDGAMDWSELFRQLDTLIGGALSFDPAVYDTSLMDDQSRLASIIIVFVAGMSVLLGQCFALFLVSASPIGFVLGLVFSGVSLTVRLGLWIAMSVLVARLLFDMPISPLNFMSIIFIATAPLIFGFLAVLPSIGIIILYGLYGWTSLNMMFGMFYGAQVPFLPAAICALSGWALALLLERLFFTRSRSARSGGFLYASREISRFSSNQILDFVKQKVKSR